MPKFEVALKETREHVVIVEAESEEEAQEIAMDEGVENSVRDQFDELVFHWARIVSPEEPSK